MWKRMQKDPRIMRRLIAVDVVLGLIVLVDGLQSGRPVSLWISVALFVTSLAILAFYVWQHMRAHNK
jgi:hypothetical protein